MVEEGKPAAEFSLANDTGQIVSLESLRRCRSSSTSRGVVLVFGDPSQKPPCADRHGDREEDEEGREVKPRRIHPEMGRCPCEREEEQESEEDRQGALIMRFMTSPSA